jgi:hypothetical protein
MIIDGEQLTSDSRLFRVGLENERVTFASRNWYSEGSQPFDAVLGALQQLTRFDKDEVCVIGHNKHESPDSVSDDVFVVCGTRSVIISQGRTNGVPTADVYEQIGSEKK